MIQKIGITERGDPALDKRWIPWVREGKPAILITKAPGVLASMLQEPEMPREPNIIVHATITGYGGTVLEPHVPVMEHSFAGYKALIDFLGSDRVVLRVDPIILTQKGLALAERTIIDVKKINPASRVRISFLDMYDHVKQRFTDAGLPLPQETFHAPQQQRWNAWKNLGEPELCGEPGMPNIPCISAKDCEILGVQPVLGEFQQRKTCGCLGNKHELLTNRYRCPHSCLYCFWRD